MADVNGFDPAPWAVDGARMRAELYRVEAYAAHPGEGVASALDCKVRQLGVPGTQVRIDSGAVRFLNRSAGVRNQIYVANGRIESRLDIAPTGAVGRSDLIIVRAEDPQYAGWPQPDPEDAPDYQYTKPFVVEGVDAQTESWVDRLDFEAIPYSAYALARVDLPPNTTTITTSMIKDLRNVANPRADRYINRRDHPASVTDINFAALTALPVDDDLFIPEWATWAFVRITMSQTMVVTNSVGGLFHAKLTDGVDDSSMVNGNMYYNEAGPSITRKDYFVAGAMSIPVELRGTTATLQMLASRTTGTGAIRLDNFTQFTFEMDFRERAA